MAQKKITVGTCVSPKRNLTNGNRLSYSTWHMVGAPQIFVRRREMLGKHALPDSR